MTPNKNDSKQGQNKRGRSATKGLSQPGVQGGRFATESGTPLPTPTGKKPSNKITKSKDSS